MRVVRNMLQRARHFRGHGVHSPYIYRIVREVFMCRRLFEPRLDGLLEAMDRELSVSQRVRRELHNIYILCGYEEFAIDPLSFESKRGFVICSKRYSDEQIEVARRCGTTVAIVGAMDQQAIDRVVREHESTTVERRGYLLIFNNHLPKQHFVL